ncbi:membrane protein [Streptomyces sp. NRRL B-3229]|uniref:membrane protein n=1 Tax=Streptomyces sp. NRRL B-3229 TaxID=1463836 RepID=UPI0004BE6F3B|nr:membrane protein [Streptomyces sp. NRRL B-3229]
MNTERPDNGEALGGGDGKAVEAQGAEEARNAEEKRGSTGPVDGETAGVEGDVETAGVEGDEVTGAVEGDEVTGAVASSAEPSEDVTDGDRSESPAGEASAEDDESPAVVPTATDGPAAPAELAGPAEPTVSAAATADEPEPEQSTPAGEPEQSTPASDADAAPEEPALLPASEALPDSEVPRDEGTGAPRSGRFRSPVAIAAVAAAVLLVGGGGAYLAASGSGGADGSGEGATSGAAGDDTPPPLALDGYGGGEGKGNGIAPGEPNPYGATYRVAGSLPEGPASAPVYRVQGQVTEDDVTRLAGALGVSGKPVAQGQVWRVGATDGSGPSLQVNRQAPGAWNFQRYSPVIDYCDSATVCGAKPGAGADDDPVSAAAAVKAAAPVLKAVGQGGARLDTSQVIGAQRVVNADPVVGGLPTDGWATGVTVNAQGEVVSGTGQLKAPVKSDTYPVLSAEKTLGLLNKVPTTGHRMGIGGCASPVPLKDRFEAPCGQSTASPAGGTLTVDKAVFGLASHFVGGRQALVPSWLFEVRPAGAEKPFTVTYPAVDPKYIAAPATATPAPSDEPTSAPKTRDVRIDGYTAEGDELTVSFTGGVCADYSASASKSSGEVKVKVTARPWRDKVCIMIAKEIQKTVTLDEPLGDREVVGTDGKQIPLNKAGARLPETSGAR